MANEGVDCEPVEPVCCFMVAEKVSPSRREEIIDFAWTGPYWTVLQDIVPVSPHLSRSKQRMIEWAACMSKHGCLETGPINPTT